MHYLLSNDVLNVHGHTSLRPCFDHNVHIFKYLHTLDFRGVPKYPSLNASFLDEPVVVVSSHNEDKVFCLDPPTRLLKRFISDEDSGVEEFSIRDDPHCDHSSVHRRTRRAVDSGCLSDNASVDSALGPSSLWLNDLSYDEEDHDTSFLGPEQTRSMLSMHRTSSAKSWAESRPKSLSEEIADVENNNQEHSTCSDHSDGNSQLYCEVCEEMCCMDCNTRKQQDHKLTTSNSVREQRKTKLQTLISTTHKKLSDAVKTKAQLRDYNTQLQEQVQFIKNEINSRRDFLHELVDRWYDKTALQLDTILQDEQTYVANMIQTLQAQINMMNKVCDDSQQLINDLTEGHRLAESADSIGYIENTNENNLLQLDRRVNLILGTGGSITQDMFGNLSWTLTEANAQPIRAIKTGKILRQFDTRHGHSNRYTCHTASGLSLTADGRIIVTDIGTDMVQIFDNEGNAKLQLNTLPLQNPTKAVSLYDGTYVVACKHNVKLFDGSGEYMRDLDSNLFCPYDVAVNRNGDIVVTDMGERQACIYMYARADHRALNCIVGGTHAPAFRNAWNVSTDRDDNIIVSDYEEHRIKIFSPNGFVICEFGEKGAGIGQFFHPAGTCTDQYGNILIADSANNRVQMFSAHGEFLAVVVGENSLLCPVDIVVNDKGELLVLQGNGEVKVYSYYR